MKQDKQILHSEEQKHTAMGSIAGIVFQFHYFIYKLLTIEPGATVSFEKLDDSATETDEVTVLIQVKHTIKSPSNGQEVLLTNRAFDLWKSIDVWMKLIITNGDQERIYNEQKAYIDEHAFVMVSNKNPENNKIVDLCNKIRRESISDDEIDRVFDDITLETRNKRNNVSKIQGQVDALKGFKLRREFLSKMQFEFINFDIIKEKCLNHIHTCIRFPQNQTQDVFDCFKVEVEKDFEECAKVGKPLSYEYSEQLKRFETVFTNKRIDSLDFQIKKEVFNPDFLKLVCIRQLVKAGDVDEKNIDKIARIVTHFLSFKNRFNELLFNYKITKIDYDNFYENTITFWKNHFERFYDDIDEYSGEKEIIERAKKLLAKIRDFEVALCKEKLLIPISNGAFYYLSDECKIGWHHEWEKFFKNCQ